MKRILMVLAAAAFTLAAQQIQFPARFDKLAKKAKRVDNVTINADALGLARQFLSEKNAEEIAAKEIVKGLKGIYIRRFEFDEPDQYTQADVDLIRAQLKAPAWKPIIDVSSKTRGKRPERTEIYAQYVKTNHARKIGGLTILTAEPKELTIIQILGTLSPKDLSRLSGSFGLPDVHLGPLREEKD